MIEITLVYMTQISNMIHCYNHDGSFYCIHTKSQMRHHCIMNRKPLRKKNEITGSTIVLVRAHKNCSVVGTWRYNLLDLYMMIKNPRTPTPRSNVKTSLVVQGVMLSVVDDLATRLDMTFCKTLCTAFLTFSDSASFALLL